MNKTKKETGDQFDIILARVVAKAIRNGKFELQGLDKTIFLAGQLSAPRIRSK